MYNIEVDYLEIRPISLLMIYSIFLILNAHKVIYHAYNPV